MASKGVSRFKTAFLMISIVASCLLSGCVQSAYLNVSGFPAVARPEEDPYRDPWIYTDRSIERRQRMCGSKGLTSRARPTAREQ